MTTVGYSTLDVIPAVKNLRAQLEQQTSRDFATAGRKGGEQFGDAAGRAAGGRFKSRVSPLLRDAFAPIAGLAAGAAIAGLFKDAIGQASDLAESGNKIQVIFGDAAKQVDAFAGRGAKALGQTRLEVLNAAGAFGTFGKAAGLTGNALASFSTDLVGLSTDLASFFNTSPEQAVEAIGAALRGEAEPIRAYGILLDDATLRQEALRQGLIQTTKQALTPQQRVLAAYQVILRQTGDAQGDFQRTSGGLANQQRILSAQWSEMQAELGAKLLPAATAVVSTFNNGVIPAVEDAGGAVADSVRAFNGLPAPIKAATAALVAFKLAQATGLTGAAASGASSIASGLDSIRLRAMLAADEYKNLRTATLETTASAHVFSPAVGRMSSALGALRTATSGAGAGLKRGLLGASSLVGGPWGAAFIAGTAIVAHFWAEHEKAKQRVEDFTATLDKETGALTASSREFVAKQLLDAGILEGAQRLGLSLDVVTDAALGQTDAWAQLKSQIAGMGQLDNQRADDAIKLKSAVEGTNSVIQKGIANHRLFGAAVGNTASQMGKTTGATHTATTALSGYAGQLADARTQVQRLLDKENERRNRLLGRQQDRLALAESLTAARQEAKEGARTLDINTAAGQANKRALLDLAAQWNDSAAAVRNAKGAYAGIREDFIKVAEQMGASEGEAKRLADRLLSLPKSKAINVTTPGMQKAIEDARRLREELRRAQLAARIQVGVQGAKNRSDFADIHGFARGGLLRGPGSGTSDSMLIWGSNGEFMHRKAAVDYYGVEFMRRLNALQIPKYARGGLVGGGGSQQVVVSTSGQEIRGHLVIDLDNGTGFLQGVAQSAASIAESRAAVAQRQQAGDGIRR